MRCLSGDEIHWLWIPGLKSILVKMFWLGSNDWTGPFLYSKMSYEQTTRNPLTKRWYEIFDDVNMWTVFVLFRIYYSGIPTRELQSIKKFQFPIVKTMLSSVYCSSSPLHLNHHENPGNKLSINLTNHAHISDKLGKIQPE